MTFVTSAFLFGGLLVSVPIIIHLMAKRKQVVMPWGAMQLLLSSKIAKKQRRMRLKDLLLLLLRILMILLLCFLFARPFMNSSWLSNPNHDFIVVLDDSLSMSRQYDENNSLFEEAKKRTKKEIEDIDENSQLKIYTASSGLKQIGPESFTDLKPRHGASNLIEDLKYLCDLPLSESSEFLQILVYTDNMKNTWPEKQRKELQELKEQLNKQKKLVDIQVIPIEPKDTITKKANLNINQLALEKTVVKKGEAFVLRAQVTNKSDIPSKERECEWKLDENTVGKTKVEALEPGKSTDINFIFHHNKIGQHVLTCRILGDDELNFDNESKVIVNIVDQIPILVVSDQPLKKKGSVSDLAYFLASIGNNPNKLDKKDSHDLFKASLCRTDKLQDINFMKYEAVVFIDVDRIAPEKRKEVIEYINSGRRIWFMTGEDTDIEQFNKNFNAPGFMLSPHRIEQLAKYKENEQHIIFASRSHLATSSLVNNETFKPSDVHIKKMHVMGGELSSNAHPLLRNKQGYPLLIEHSFAGGKVICQYFGLSREWSDFSFSRFFVTYTNEMLWYMMKPNMPKERYALGDSFEKILSSKNLSSYNVVRPNELKEERMHHGGRLIFNETDSVGLYRLNYKVDKNKDREELFYVSAPTSESDLSLLPAKEMKEIQSVSGIRFLDQVKEVSFDQSEGDSNKPMDQLLALLLMSLVIFEVIFAIRGLWRVSFFAGAKSKPV